MTCYLLAMKAAAILEAEGKLESNLAEHTTMLASFGEVM